MRIRGFAAALLALPLALSACTGSATPSASASPDPSSTPWLMYAPGTASPSSVPLFSVSPSTSPSVSLSATPSDCATYWPSNVGDVLIPMTVTPLAGSLKVSWPNRYGNVYRVAAIDQVLVSGAQPQPTWVTVTNPTGCTASATLSGLKSKHPYIVWLDAPNTPRDSANTRSLYSGKSGVIDTL